MISSSDKLTSVKDPDSVASPLGGAIPVQIPIDVSDIHLLHTQPKISALE